MSQFTYESNHGFFVIKYLHQNKIDFKPGFLRITTIILFLNEILNLINVCSIRIDNVLPFILFYIFVGNNVRWVCL